MNRLSKSLIALIAGVAIAGTAYARPSVYPTGVTIYDPAEAYNGYTLINEDWKNIYAYVDPKGKGLFPDVELNFSGPIFSTHDKEGGDAVKLIDMNGNIVNTWKVPSGGKKNYLMPNGNIVAMSEDTEEIIEYNWEGEVVWKFQTRLGPHHDLERLPNGNTLILCYENIPSSKIEALVDRTSTHWGKQERSKLKIYGDSIIEVDPEGKVVWSWLSSENFDLAKYHEAMVPRDWTHGNTVSALPENKWYDAGDERFKPGNILYNPRHFNQFVIISRDTGKVVWESPEDFNGGLGGFANPHEPYMIPKGYPGEGNFMIFDNGNQAKIAQRNVHSVIWEIRPDTFEVVWRYLTAPGPSNRFHSMVKSSAYKLPNGNVLISEDMGSRAFQVQPDNMHPDGGKIVWEYVSPSGLARTQMYSYEHTPQLKALGKPEEMKVSSFDPINFKVLPDKLRKDGVLVEYTPE